VGTSLARALIARGHSVFGTTRSPSRIDTLRREGLTPVLLDLLQPSLSLPAADRIYVLVSGTRDGTLPRGLENLLRTLRDRKPERLIYTSSTAVYGEYAGGWVDEGSARQASHPAGLALIRAEDLLLSSAELGGLPGILARVSGIYGPNRIPGRDRIMKGEPVPGDAGVYLNLIHVDDLVSGLMALAERGRVGETYLFSDDLPVKREEYYRFLAGCLNAPQAIFGGKSSEERTGSRRCQNSKITQDLALMLKFPSYREGLSALLGGGGG